MEPRKQDVIEIGKRFAQARELRGVSQKDVADAVGKSQTAISYIEKGRNDEPSKNLPEIAEFLRVSHEWLRYGRGDMEDSRQLALDHSKNRLNNMIAEVEPEDSYLRDNNVMLPEVEMRASLGPGNETNSAEVVKQRWPFDHRLLMLEGVTPTDVVLMRGAGQSMFPTICDGDLVAVNKSVVGAPGDGVYAIETDSGIRFKRINVRVDGSVEIISDNADKERYPTEIYPADVADEIIKVRGKVLFTYYHKIS